MEESMSARAAILHRFMILDRACLLLEYFVNLPYKCIEDVFGETEMICCCGLLCKDG
jgi:hypothetical protein